MMKYIAVTCIAIFFVRTIFAFNLTEEESKNDKNNDAFSFTNFSKKVLKTANNLRGYVFSSEITRGEKGKPWWSRLKDLFCCCFSCGSSENKSKKKRKNDETTNEETLPNILDNKKSYSDVVDDVKHSPRTETIPLNCQSEECYRSDHEVDDSKLSERLQTRIWNNDNVKQELCEMAADPKSTEATTKSRNFDIIKHMCMQINSFNYGTVAFIQQALDNLKNLKKLEWMEECEKKKNNPHFQNTSKIKYEPFPTERLEELEKLLNTVTEHAEKLKQRFGETLENGTGANLDVRPKRKERRNSNKSNPKN